MTEITFEEYLKTYNTKAFLDAISLLNRLNPKLADFIIRPRKYIENKKIEVVIDELSEQSIKFQDIKKWDPVIFKNVAEELVRMFAVLLLVENGYEPAEALKLAPDPEVKVKYVNGRMYIEYIVDRGELGFIKASQLKKFVNKFSQSNAPPTSSIIRAGADGLTINAETLRQYVQWLTQHGLDKSVLDKAIEVTKKRGKKGRLTTWLLPIKARDKGRPKHSFTSPIMHIILAFLYINDAIAPLSVGSVIDFVLAVLPIMPRSRMYKYLARLRDAGLIEYDYRGVKLTDVGKLWVITNAQRIVDTIMRYVDLNITFKKGSSPRSSPLFSLFSANNPHPESALQFLQKRKQGNGKASKSHLEKPANAILKFLYAFMKKHGVAGSPVARLRFEHVLFAMKRIFAMSDDEMKTIITTMMATFIDGKTTHDIEELNDIHYKLWGEKLDANYLPAIRRLNWLRFVFFNPKKKLIALWDFGKVIMAMIRPMVEHAMVQFALLLHHLVELDDVIIEMLKDEDVKCVEMVEQAVWVARSIA